MALDAGDWLTICTAMVGGIAALSLSGDSSLVPSAFWFLGGLCCGAVLTTAALAWRR